MLLTSNYNEAEALVALPAQDACAFLVFEDESVETTCFGHRLDDVLDRVIARLPVGVTTSTLRAERKPHDATAGLTDPFLVLVFTDLVAGVAHLPFKLDEPDERAAAHLALGLRYKNDTIGRGVVENDHTTREVPEVADRVASPHVFGLLEVQIDLDGIPVVDERAVAFRPPVTLSATGESSPDEEVLDVTVSVTRTHEVPLASVFSGIENDCDLITAEIVGGRENKIGPIHGNRHRDSGEF